MSKRLLQIFVAVLALVPVGIGTIGLIDGPRFLRGVATVPVDLDSHFRYLSGLFLMLGITFWACVPSIERKATLFQMAGSLVIVGGIGRLLSLLLAGPPSQGHLIGLGLELVVLPVLMIWQAQLARAYRELAETAQSK